jgi:hypothetical protein
MRKLTLFAAVAAIAAIALMSAGSVRADNLNAGAGAKSNANVDSHDTYEGSDYSKLDVAVNSAFAPNLWATSDTCMGSSSVGVQAMLFGFSTGTTWRDEDCVRRKDARELYNMGNAMPQLYVAAVARTCQKSANVAAMHAAGLACPGEGTDAATTRIHGSQFYGINVNHVVEGTAPAQDKPVGAPAPAPVAEPRG